MIENIDQAVLGSIENTWKPVSTIARELEESVVRVNRCIISLKKRDKVIYTYSEDKKVGRIPILYMRK